MADTVRKYQDLTEQAPFWNDKDIKVDAVVEGKVVLIKPARGAKSSPVLVLEKDDGTNVNVWMKTIIASSLEDVAQEGDFVKLTYRGLKKSGKDGTGTEYHDYKVELARQ